MPPELALAEPWLPQEEGGFAEYAAIIEEPSPAAAPDIDSSDEPGVFPWLITAADLLSGADPGPTEMLVENLIVDRSITAAVGRWKVMKSLVLLDLGVSVSSGRAAFGRLKIEEPGPVVFVIEESGRAALWRRLDALRRGRGIDRDELRDLHVATNEGVRLDDLEWQKRLIDAGQTIRPRLMVFDPLARMKAASREENAQADMAVLIEFLRRLRDEADTTVAFVHHTGHTGTQMRGSSDLESAWETRLFWERDGQSPDITLKAEHREAEAADPLTIHAAWDANTRSLRFDLTEDSLETAITEHLQQQGDQRVDDIASTLQKRPTDVRSALRKLEEAGTTHSGPSGRRDKNGRPIRDKVWNLAPQAESWPVPETGTTQDEPPPWHRGSVARPASLEADGGTSHPDNGTEEAEIERLAALAEVVIEGFQGDAHARSES